MSSDSVFILGSQAQYQVNDILLQTQVFQADKSTTLKKDKKNANIHKSTSSPQTLSIPLNKPINASQICIKPKKSSLKCGSWMRCGTTARNNSDLDMEDFRSDTVSSNLSTGGLETVEHSGLTHRFNKRKHCDNTMPYFEPREEKIHMSRSGGAHTNKCSVFRAILSGFRAKRNRKRKLSMDELDTMDPYALRCSYKDSCRCLDCQSRYFECDDDESEYGTYSLTDDSLQYMEEHETLNTPPAIEMDISTSPDSDFEEIYDEDVFIDEVVQDEDDNSTFLLIENDEIGQKLDNSDQNDVKLSVGSETDSSNATKTSVTLDNDAMELEMAAGTPVVLDYLLNHPLTCCVM